MHNIFTPLQVTIVLLALDMHKNLLALLEHSAIELVWMTAVIVTLVLVATTVMKKHKQTTQNYVILGM